MDGEMQCYYMTMNVSVMAASVQAAARVLTSYCRSIEGHDLHTEGRVIRASVGQYVSSAPLPVSGGDHDLDPHARANAVAHNASIEARPSSEDFVRRLMTYIAHAEDGNADLANEALTQADWDAIVDLRDALAADEATLEAEFDQRYPPVSGGDHDLDIVFGVLTPYVVVVKTEDDIEVVSGAEAKTSDGSDPKVMAIAMANRANQTIALQPAFHGLRAVPVLLASPADTWDWDDSGYGLEEAEGAFWATMGPHWHVYIGSPNDTAEGPYPTREVAIEAAETVMAMWFGEDEPVVVDHDTAEDGTVTGWMVYQSEADVADTRRLGQHIWVDTCTERACWDDLT